MKEILDIVMLLGFVFVLFIFIRGMNETQTQKNLDRLKKSEKINKNKDNSKGEEI